MSLRPDLILEIPEQTVRIARAAFPKGNVYMQMRDELGVLYENGQFAELYSHTGQPAITAWRLALITVMQFAENLTDRQAADAVRGRIDWKYALGLELEDAGFHYSVLSEFRARLIAGQQEQMLLDAMLDSFRDKKLLKSRGKQRTDSTHILGSIRGVNRLELVGEALHHTLNVLATVAPEWLKQQVTPSWFERYGQRMDDARLPDEEADRAALAWLIGQDGYYLLNWIEAAPESLAYLRQLPAVQMLRQIWVQQYCWIDGKLHWRLRHEHGMPPAAITILSPYDLEVRYGEKRGMAWVGYKLHLTETCEDEQVHLITHVETTTATVSDNHLVDTIHEALAHRDLLPGQHLVDAGYPDGENILSSQDDYQVDLVGRIRPDNGWQAREVTGYDASQFQINWEILRATCPQGQQSYPGKSGIDPSHRPIVRLIFPPSVCRACVVKLQCTRGKSRHLNLLPHRQHEALQAARQRQSTEEFKEIYRRRAGVEGTISQAVYALTLRRSRYIGVAKTHLQHIATAAAINLIRVIHWLNGMPLAPTRVSPFARLAPA